MKHSVPVTLAIPPTPRPRSPVRSCVRANRALAEKFDAWLTAVNYSASTRKEYLAIVEQFTRFIRTKRLTDVWRQDIRAFLAHLAERGLAPSSLAARLSGLKTFYDFLNLGGVVTFCPTQLMRPRKVPK